MERRAVAAADTYDDLLLDVAFVLGKDASRITKADLVEELPVVKNRAKNYLPADQPFPSDDELIRELLAAVARIRQSEPELVGLSSSTYAAALRNVFDKEIWDISDEELKTALPDLKVELEDSRTARNISRFKNKKPLIAPLPDDATLLRTFQDIRDQAVSDYTARTRSEYGANVIQQETPVSPRQRQVLPRLLTETETSSLVAPLMFLPESYPQLAYFEYDPETSTYSFDLSTYVKEAEPTDSEAQKTLFDYLMSGLTKAGYNAVSGQFKVRGESSWEAFARAFNALRPPIKLSSRTVYFPYLSYSKSVSERAPGMYVLDFDKFADYFGLKDPRGSDKIVPSVVLMNALKEKGYVLGPGRKFFIRQEDWADFVDTFNEIVRSSEWTQVLPSKSQAETIARPASQRTAAAYYNLFREYDLAGSSWELNKEQGCIIAKPLDLDKVVREGGVWTYKEGDRVFFDGDIGPVAVTVTARLPFGKYKVKSDLGVEQEVTESQLFTRSQLL